MTIITPILNGAPFIEELVRSVKNQSCPNWEWFIINDGSTDDTAVRLEELKDSRIKVIHQANAGASAARNVGLDHARGAYVTFLDADDLLPRDALELRMAYLDAHPDVDIVNGGVCVTSQERVLRQYTPDLAEGRLLDRLARLEEGVFFSVNYMIRRHKIGDHRFLEGQTHCEDLIFFLTLAHDARLRYSAVPEVIYEYRIQPGSAMSNLEGIERGYLDLIHHSKTLSELSPAMRQAQMRRVRRILVRSWLRRLRPDRAMRALLKLQNARKNPA